MNNMGDEGVRMLAKSNWPKLQYIELRRKFTIQNSIKLDLD